MGRRGEDGEESDAKERREKKGRKRRGKRGCLSWAEGERRGTAALNSFSGNLLLPQIPFGKGKPDTREPRWRRAEGEGMERRMVDGRGWMVEGGWPRVDGRGGMAKGGWQRVDGEGWNWMVDDG